MKKFPTTLLIAVGTLTFVCASTIINRETIADLQENLWLEKDLNREQKRLLQEQEELFYLLYLEVQQLKTSNDNLELAPEPTEPTIIWL